MAATGHARVELGSPSGFPFPSSGFAPLSRSTFSPSTRQGIPHSGEIEPGKVGLCEVRVPKSEVRMEKRQSRGAVDVARQQVGVEGNHRASARRCVGQQTPILHRGAERSQMAAFGELPATVRLWLGLGLAEDHLLSGLGEERRHAQMEPCRESFDLPVKRVGQMHFGSFHGGNLPHQSGLGQEALWECPRFRLFDFAALSHQPLAG